MGKKIPAGTSQLEVEVLKGGSMVGQAPMWRVGQLPKGETATPLRGCGGAGRLNRPDETTTQMRS